MSFAVFVSFPGLCLGMCTNCNNRSSLDDAWVRVCKFWQALPEQLFFLLTLCKTQNTPTHFPLVQNFSNALPHPVTCVTPLVWRKKWESKSIHISLQWALRSKKHIHYRQLYRNPEICQTPFSSTEHKKSVLSKALCPRRSQGQNKSQIQD